MKKVYSFNDNGFDGRYVMGADSTSTFQDWPENSCTEGSCKVGQVPLKEGF